MPKKIPLDEVVIDSDSESESSSVASSTASEKPLGPRTIELKTFYWSFEESDEDHKLKIHVGGKTEDGRTVQLIINDFQPFVYIELPVRTGGWNKNKCRTLFEYFKRVMRDDAPVSYEMLTKYKLQGKVRIATLRLKFNTHTASQKLANKCRYRGGLSTPLGFFKPDTLKVHEGNIDPIVKFTALKNLKLAGWVRVTETILPGEENLDVGDRKFSTADVDMYVSCANIEAFTPEELRIVKTKVVSFDIECTSQNHNSKLPDPDNIHNRIFQIANTVCNLGDPASSRKHQLFTLGNPKDIPNVEIFRCKDEKTLLLKWKSETQKHLHDAYIGYNSMKFDWHYMIKRAELLGIYSSFSAFSRLIGKKAVLREKSWASAAYGEQKFSYFDPVGITNVDILLGVERGHKLSTYSLNAVAEHFLKEKKDDVTPRQLFMTHDLTFKLGPMLEGLPKGRVPRKTRVTLKKIVQKELQLRRCTGEILAWRTRLMECKTGRQFVETLRDGLTITGKYNVQDTVLPIQLCEKLNVWTTMEELANCTHVPMSYLDTRGQTVRVMAQMYRDTIFNNIIIPFRAKTDEIKEKFEGAIVVDADPGDHWNVACKDFESLYPSMMIAFNICHTTLLNDDDPIPDDQCNVLEWESHVGCKCDPKKRKKAAADVICKKYRYRFRKVIVHPDGTREHEGLMPKLVRNLLTSRKVVKKELAPFAARLKMLEGKAEQCDIDFYRKIGWEVVEKGALSKTDLDILKVQVAVLDARQLALKVCANSVRPDTPIPCKIAGVFNYLPIDKLAKLGPGGSGWVKDEDGNEVAEPIDNLLVWSDVGFTEVKYVFRHAMKEGEKMKRVFTHQGIVDVTEDHSLLTPGGKEVTTKELKIGDDLMHVPVPLSETISASDVPIFVECAKYSKVDAAKLYHHFRTLGVAASFIPHGNQVEISFKLETSPSPSGVLKIEDLVVEKTYVYDIETKSHHFAAGLGDLIVHNSAYGVLGAQNGFAPLVPGAASVTAMGRRMITEAIRYIKQRYPGDPVTGKGRAELVYGDTDSAMIKYHDLDTKESFEMGDKVCSETSHYLKCWTIGVKETFTIQEPGTTGKANRHTLNKYPRSKLEGLSDEDLVTIHTYDANPINLQFENLYQRFFLLTMKRYVAHAANRQGVVIAKIYKGVCLKRRDNSLFLRDTYDIPVHSILKNESQQEIMHRIYDQIHKLFTRQIPDANLIIYMGVKTVQSYAKKKEVKRRDGTSEIAYLDANKEIITDPVGPLDPRLVYSNIPQVLLSLKMLRRGDDVPPNTRLEFLYLKNPKAVRQGDRAEDYTFYRENKANLRLEPDPLHYVEKQLMKPMTEIISVKWPGEKYLYEKIEDAYARCIEGLEEILKHEVRKIKNYSRVANGELSTAYDSKVRVGYGASKSGGCTDCTSVWPKECRKHRKMAEKRGRPGESKKYVYKKAIPAQLQYILDSAMRKKLNPSAKREIDEAKYPELLRVCRKWKSRLVLEKVYSQFADGTRGPKLKKRPVKRPTQTGEKLRVMTANKPIQVMLTKKIGKYDRGTMVTLRDVTELVDGKKKEYFYDIELPNGKLVEKVERSGLATWLVRDGTIFKDILLYRGSYSVVVAHLKKIFCPLVFGTATEDLELFDVGDIEEADEE